jgi:hypothetical protein
MANIVVSAIATFNGKGLTKGQKQIKSFEKSVKSLGRTFGLAFTAAGIVNFSKKAITAFVADEAAAKALEMQLKNTGYAFSAPDIEYFIANMQKLYGVLDDQLRPAFQTLLTASGSITKSQKALNTVLNVSAATGKSVEEVSAAVAKGFSGQTTALTRLGAGLSKATLASGDMVAILDELDAKFAGQATARLGTYAGKMDQLKVAAANASEIIGGSLLDSLSRLSRDNSLSGFTGLIEGLAEKLAAIDKAVFNFVGNMMGIRKKTSTFSYSLGAGAGTELAKIQEKKKIKEAITLRTQENTQLKAKTAVDALKDKFDLERIGLTAALNAATDDETKLRIKAQLAILDNNEALAKKYLAEMNGVKSVTDLATATKVAADSMLMTAAKLMTSLGVSPSQVSAGGAITGAAASGGSIGAGLFNVKGLETTSINQGMLGTSAGAKELSISLGFTDTSNITDELTKAVVKAITISTKNGISTVPAGQGF